jgi:hypothetical protein
MIKPTRANGDQGTVFVGSAGDGENARDLANLFRSIDRIRSEVPCTRSVRRR